MQSTVSRKAINGVKWTSLSAVMSSLAKLLQVVILTRFLVKEDFGLVAIALLVNSFCAIFMDMGITAAVMHKPEVTKKAYSSLYWFSIGLGAILTLLASLSAYPLSVYYEQKELISIVPFTALNILFGSISGLQRTMQQKKMNFKFISIVEIISSIIMLLCSALLAFYDYGVYSLVYSTLINGFLIAIIYLCYGVFIEKNLALHFKLTDIYDYLRIGIYQVGTSTLDFLSQEMDVLIISSSFSVSFLGGYTLCKQIVTRLYGLINPIITKILTPTLALYQKNIFLLKEKYLQIIKFLAFINIPIYFLVSINSKEILRILYGVSYIDYFYILSILAINYGILSLGNPVGSLIIATGKTDIGFKWTIFRIIIVFISLYIASSYSTVIFLLVLLCVNVFNIYPSWYIIYRNIIDMSFGELVKTMWQPLVICTTLLVSIYLFEGTIESIVFSLITKTALFCLLYIIAMLLLDRHYIYKIKNIILNKQL